MSLHQRTLNLMFSKIRNLAKMQLLRDALKLSSGNVLLYLLPIFVTPVLSRLYQPEQFGEWGVFSSVVTIIGVILLGGFEYAVIRCEENEVKKVIKLCLFSVCIILLGSIAFFVIGDVMNLPFVKNFPYPLGALVFLMVNALTLMFQNLANRYKRYWSMSICNLVIGFSQAVLRISFAFCILFVNGLILGTICAQIIGSLFLFIVLFKKLREMMASSSTNLPLMSVAKKFKKFPLYDAPSTLLSFASFNLPIVILLSFYTKGQLGCYSMVLQLLLMPISVVGAAIGSVYYQRISENGTSDGIRTETQNLLKIVIWLSSLPTIFFCLGGDWLLVKFLGNKWQTAGGMALCLSIWSIATILTQPLLSLYRQLDKQNRMLTFNLLYFVLSIGAIFICTNMQFPLYTTILIYSLFAFFPRILMFLDIVKLSGNRLAYLCSGVKVPIYVLIVVMLAYRLLYLNII